MRKILLVSVLFFLSFAAFAQNESPDSLSIQATIDACIQLRDAVAAGNNAAIKQSAEQLRACNTVSFDGLTCMDDSTVSLNGHLVFDEAFADSLAAGKNVYQEADEMNDDRATRGMVGDGPRTTSHVILARKSSKFTFRSMGWQEVAVIAERGGKVTMNIHVSNSAGFKKNYDDTDDVWIGRSERKRGFRLPDYPACIVELEIVNCGDKDTSVVVVSN